MNTQNIETAGGEVPGVPLFVAGPRRLQLTTLQKLGVAGLIVAVFLAFIWLDYAWKTSDADKQPEVSVQPSPTPPFRPAPESLSQTADPVPAVQAGDAHEAAPEESPLIAYMGGGSQEQASATSGSKNDAAPATGHIVPALTPASDTANIAGRLKPTVADVTTATLLPHPDMLITKGTTIACTLTTAINTELAGFVKCVLPEAVRSTTGNVVLLDRGTTVVGEIQSGVAQGQNRVFILWDRAETPDHAIISLDSPGADELGRAGFGGSVHSHFWQRFGSALMLSVVDGALQAGTALASSSKRGGGTSFNNFQSKGQQLSNDALKGQMNIPPTLEKHQGENVTLFVARDIDFSGIYSLAVLSK
jgi:type IV secretion system protein VirB10